MNKSKIIIGYIIICLGLFLYLSKKIIDNNREILENNKVEYTLEKEISYHKIENTYDAILSIPKIILKKGIYSKGDIRNNIEENIMIHNDSIYPNKDDSNVILIAHSGSGPKAIFKDLEKLDTDSLVEFYYHHTKYVYKIDNIYCVNKTGSIDLEIKDNKKRITLITCDSKNKNKQVVYTGYLIDEIKY